MPELRKDPIVGRWVIIATDRAKRPVAPKNEPLPGGGLCPFCETALSGERSSRPRRRRPDDERERERERERELEETGTPKRRPRNPGKKQRTGSAAVTGESDAPREGSRHPGAEE